MVCVALGECPAPIIDELGSLLAGLWLQQVLSFFAVKRKGGWKIALNHSCTCSQEWLDGGVGIVMLFYWLVVSQMYVLKKMDPNAPHLVQDSDEEIITIDDDWCDALLRYLGNRVQHIKDRKVGHLQQLTKFPHQFWFVDLHICLLGGFYSFSPSR